jgi:hypothetical protein
MRRYRACLLPIAAQDLRFRPAGRGRGALFTAQLTADRRGTRADRAAKTVVAGVLRRKAKRI